MTVVPLVKNVVVAVHSLVEHPLNWAEHDDNQLAAIRATIEKFGWRQPLIVNSRSGYLLDGHARLTIAKEAGWTHVPVTYVDLDEAEELELLASYNQTARLAGTDEQLLANLLGRLDSEYGVLPIGYDAPFVEDLLDRFEPLWALPDVSLPLADFDPEEPDVAPEEKIPEEAPERVRLYDLWQVGDHRLICGDCRDVHVLEQLLRRPGEPDPDKEGGVVRLEAGVAGIFTSPPYAMQRADQYGGTLPDDYVLWFSAVQAPLQEILLPGASFFLNMKPHVEECERVLYVFDLVLSMKRDWDWRFIDELCWKSHGYPTGNQYRFKNAFEPVYQFCRTNRPRMFPDAVRYESPHATDQVSRKFFPNPGDSKFKEGDITSGTMSGFVNMDHFSLEDLTTARPSNVIEVHQSQLKAGHPAAFPIGLPRFFMEAYSLAGELWLDPFAGSGSVAVAAHECGRRSASVELVPRYCDVILARLEERTGEAAVLLEREQ